MAQSPSSPQSRFSLLNAIGLDQHGICHGLRMAMAAWLAFTVAALAGLPNPFWAGMPVWVVAQNSRGLLFERGIWRTIGTLIGAGVGFGLLHVLQSPMLQLLALALWVALCSAGTHLIRGVRAYGVTLAGMTAAVVILPAVIMPDQAMELAVSRVICTLIGVVTVTLVTGLSTPPAPRKQYVKNIVQLARDIASLTSPPDAAQERAWLTTIHQMENDITPMTASTLGADRQREHIEAALQAAVAALAAWRVIAARPENQGKSDHDTVRSHLKVAVEQLQGVDESLLQTSTTTPRPHSSALDPYYDWTRARYAGVLAGTATFLAASLGMLWPGPEGELAALGVCIFSMVLSSLPMPHLVAPKMLVGVCTGVVIATLYRIFVQPYANTGLTALVLTMAPFLLLGGLARASRRPWIAMPSLDANMCFLLASQAGLPAVDVAGIFQGSFALVLAAAVIAVGAICLPEKPRRHAIEAWQALQSGLHALLAAPPRSDAASGWQPLGIRHTLRLAAYWDYLAVRGTPGPAADATASTPDVPNTPAPSPLDAFNMGQAAADLRAQLLAPNLNASARPVLAQALEILRDNGASAPAQAAQRLQELSPPDEMTRLLLNDTIRTLQSLSRAHWLPMSTN